MPKKKSIWRRETPCLACDTPMVNFQFMTKSQTITFDGWLVPHTQSVSDYEDFPDVLKTTVCPGCLTASNEYSFGVDDYKYFFRNPRKNELIREFFKKTVDNRFQVLAKEFAYFEKESAKLDQQNNRPPHTRTKATFERIWKEKEKYGVPFFTLMLQEPRDHVTALVCFALDRYCQLLRITFDNDIEPKKWDYESLKAAVEDFFAKKTLDMKAQEPRFYYIAINFLQSIQFLEELGEITGDKNRHGDIADSYFEEAYRYVQLSFANDDIKTIPYEVKEGGINLLLAKMHLAFEKEEEALKCIRYAKIYADRLTRIGSQNQLNFVKEVDELNKKYLIGEEKDAKKK